MVVPAWGIGGWVGEGNTHPPTALSPEEHQGGLAGPDRPGPALQGRVGAGVGRPLRDLRYTLNIAHSGPMCARSHPGKPGPGQSPCRGLPWTSPGKRARFHLITCKVSQNGEVSPENLNKASHSPYSQNGVQKSPLEILRFLFSPAFSCKELMGPF